MFDSRELPNGSPAEQGLSSIAVAVGVCVCSRLFARPESRLIRIPSSSFPKIPVSSYLPGGNLGEPREKQGTAAGLGPHRGSVVLCTTTLPRFLSPSANTLLVSGAQLLKYPGMLHLFIYLHSWPGGTERQTWSSVSASGTSTAVQIQIPHFPTGPWTQRV